MWTVYVCVCVCACVIVCVRVCVCMCVCARVCMNGSLNVAVLLSQFQNVAICNEQALFRLDCIGCRRDN